MRVTNNMIMNNAASNINSTKEIVNEKNTQMTNQKKINKPSDDPVIAVRSLRLSATLAQVTQYYEKNIPDATSWLDVTETALINMRKAVTDCRTLADKGAQDSLSQEDRNTILTQLKSLQNVIFDEGNADYAGRTVFTGYRTDSDLVFTEDEKDTSYIITQDFKLVDALEEHRYYDGKVVVPTTKEELANMTELEKADVSQSNYYRVRLNYNEVDAAGLESLSLKFGKESPYADNDPIVFQRESHTAADGTVTYTYPTGATVNFTDNSTTPPTVSTEDWKFTIFANEGEWSQDAAHAKKTVEDNEIVFIEETGEFIFGKNLSTEFNKYDMSMSTTYDKTGFKDGELRPEYYYNCKLTTDKTGAEVDPPIDYKKFDENGKVRNFDIAYTVAVDQTIVVNTEASNVFDSSIQRDLGEMINAVNDAIEANEKLIKIESMKKETQYASSECQKQLDLWYDAAKKEADYANDNMQKLYNTEIGKIDNYFAKINLAITDLGCKTASLQLTERRMGDQQETVTDLQSKNDDIDLSKIIIEYTAAYTAYQASLTAAGKLGDSTLLNYI